MQIFFLLHKHFIFTVDKLEDTDMEQIKTSIINATYK